MNSFSQRAVRDIVAVETVKLSSRQLQYYMFSLLFTRHPFHLQFTSPIHWWEEEEEEEVVEEEEAGGS